MVFCGKTDVGKQRDNNQDSYYVGYIGEEELEEPVFLAVVCDGMGGANGGNVASELAIRVFREELVNGMKSVIGEKLPDDTSESILLYAVRSANQAVYKASRDNAELRGMGTTLVAMMVFRNSVYVVNVGDSRLYVMYGKTLRQLTHDHSYVQTLVDKGQITSSEAKDHPNKNVIMRAVGTETEVSPDFFKIFPDKKCFLLCSDGLSNFVDEEAIEELLIGNPSPDAAVEKLIERANENGGGDNITAVLVRM